MLLCQMTCLNKKAGAGDGPAAEARQQQKMDDKAAALPALHPLIKSRPWVHAANPLAARRTLSSMDQKGELPGPTIQGQPAAAALVRSLLEISAFSVQAVESNASMC